MGIYFVNLCGDHFIIRFVNKQVCVCAQKRSIPLGHITGAKVNKRVSGPLE